MLVTVYLTEGLVSSAELLLCLRDGDWARVGRDRAADFFFFFFFMTNRLS